MLFVVGRLRLFRLLALAAEEGAGEVEAEGEAEEACWSFWEVSSSRLPQRTKSFSRRARSASGSERRLVEVSKICVNPKEEGGGCENVLLSALAQ